VAFQDQTLTCVDCGKEFTFTASEQEFYQQKGFANAPKRCPEDRQRRKEEKRRDTRGGSRESFKITCANCGREDTVPFQPKGDRPVLCRDCFRQSRQAA